MTDFSGALQGLKGLPRRAPALGPVLGYENHWVSILWRFYKELRFMVGVFGFAV